MTISSQEQVKSTEKSEILRYIDDLLKITDSFIKCASRTRHICNNKILRLSIDFRDRVLEFEEKISKVD